jgi:hypothetical protein
MTPLKLSILTGKIVKQCSDCGKGKMDFAFKDSGGEMSRTALGAGDAIDCRSRDNGGGAATGGTNKKVTGSRIYRRSGGATSVRPAWA